MPLNKNDLQQIGQLFSKGIGGLVTPQFEDLRSEISSLKFEISELRTEISQLKAQSTAVETSAHRIEREILALNNDIKEIYGMLSHTNAKTKEEKQFQKLALEKKILATYKNTLNIAKQAGIKLES